MRAPTDVQKLSTPTEAAAAQALVAARALAPLLSKRSREKTVTIRPENGLPAEAVSVPLDAFRLFVKILEDMAVGKAVAIFPYEPELTTQQAAELLNVSRPYFIRLLTDGQIRFHMVGTHRRVKLSDVLEYRRKSDEEAAQIADQLSAEGQKLGFDY